MIAERKPTRLFLSVFFVSILFRSFWNIFLLIVLEQSGELPVVAGFHLPQVAGSWLLWGCHSIAEVSTLLVCLVLYGRRPGIKEDTRYL